MYKFPLAKKIYQHIFLISFFKSLGLMLQSQIGILQALDIISDREVVYKYEIINLTNHIKEGKSFSLFLKNNSIVFTKNSEHFIKVGESTGTLSDSCAHFSEYLEFDLKSYLEKGSRLIEPILMVFIGFIVGFISLALISPLYEISRLSSI